MDASRVHPAPTTLRKEGPTKEQDLHGTVIRVTRDGLAYGGDFAPFDEMVGTPPASRRLWNPATSLFQVAVSRRNGPDLVVRDLPLQTAERLQRAIADALRERRTRGRQSRGSR